MGLFGCFSCGRKRGATATVPSHRALRHSSSSGGVGGSVHSLGGSLSGLDGDIGGFESLSQNLDLRPSFSGGATMSGFGGDVAGSSFGFRGISLGSSDLSHGTIASARLHRGGVSWLIDYRESLSIEMNKYSCREPRVPDSYVESYKDDCQKMVFYDKRRIILLTTGNSFRCSIIERDAPNISTRREVERYLSNSFRVQNHDSDMILCGFDSHQNVYFNEMVYTDGTIREMPFTIAGSGSSVFLPDDIDRLRNLCWANWENVPRGETEFYADISVGIAQKSLLDIGLHAISNDEKCGFPLRLGTMIWGDEADIRRFYSTNIPRWWWGLTWMDLNVFDLMGLDPSRLPHSPNAIRYIKEDYDAMYWDRPTPSTLSLH